MAKVIIVSLSTITPSKKAQKKIDNTQDSQLVPHATTNRAFKCLTSEIERDQVLSQENGRQLMQ